MNVGSMPSRGYLPMEFDWENHARKMLNAIGDRRGLVWLTMVYACHECGTEGRIAAEVGVEGPQDLRDRKLFIASPFSFDCGCGGLANHVRLRDDDEFEPRPRKPNESCFVLPPDNWQAGATLDRAEENFG